MRPLNVERYRVKPSTRLNLDRYDPADTVRAESLVGAVCVSGHGRCGQRQRHQTCDALPERGRIGVFNRSYYEETLVTRVHPDLLLKQHLPASAITSNIWRERFDDICAIERYLARNGTVIRKIYLNVSKAEQRRRFLMRLSDPAKRWKFSVNDVNERLKWNKYMAAYTDVMKSTSTTEAPWYIVPDMSRRDHLALREAKRRLRAP